MPSTISRIQPSYKQGFAPRDGEPRLAAAHRGLVGAWSPGLGNTGLTTLRDVSGRGNHGTMQGSMTADDWVLSEGRYALDFDGDNDAVYVETMSPSFNGATAITMACWLNTPSVAATSVPFYYPNALNTQAVGLLLITSTSIRFDAVVAGTNITVATLTDAWHHMAVTWDGATKRGYWDGDEVYSASQTGSITTSTNELNIGRFSSGLFNHFTGLVDDCLISTLGFTPSLIQDIYQAGRDGIFALEDVFVGKAPAAPPVGTMLKRFTTMQGGIGGNLTTGNMTGGMNA